MTDAPPTASTFVDTHCHLDAAEFDADRDAVVAAAVAAGVTDMVIPAIERDHFGAVASVCRSHRGCHPAWGIHPLRVGRACTEDLDALRDMLRDNRATAVAVGEIGLDFFVAGHDAKLQEFFFAEQLKIAREFDLPVILHVRRAVDAILAQLRRIPVRGGIAHAFNGSRQQADILIALGFRLGFGGAMTFPRAARIRTLATHLPLAAIVLETDAPDIPPAWCDHGRGRNTPDQLPRIAATLAQLRGLPPAEIARATTANAREALRLRPETTRPAWRAG